MKHSLHFVREYGARDLAPYFLNLDGVEFWFSDCPSRKWRDYESPTIAEFCSRVFESVREHGVMNPINVDQLERGGEIVRVVRHGATRLWAARILDLKVPIVIDVKAGTPPPGAVPLDSLDMYHGRHDVHEHRGVVRIKARQNERFPT